MAGIGISVGIARNSLGGAPAGASYLLDTYPAFAAYSTRQLAADATNCIICTEDGGGTEQIIGFSAGWLDEAAVASHCLTNTGSVAQMYDQGVGGLHAINVTDANQPRIYNGTAVLKLNAKPALTRVTVNTALEATTTEQAQPNTLFCVGQLTASGAANYLHDGGFSSLKRHAVVNISSTNNYCIYAGKIINSGASQSGSQILTSTMFNSTSSVGRVNGSQVASGDADVDPLHNIVLLNSAFKNQAGEYIQELIVYTSDQTANFAAIEADINAAFSVYA